VNYIERFVELAFPNDYKPLGKSMQGLDTTPPQLLPSLVLNTWRASVTALPMVLSSFHNAPSGTFVFVRAEPRA